MCSVVVYICVWLMYFGMCSISTINAEICKSTDSFEVDALREAARELGKLDWNCTDDPCAKRSSCWFSDDVTRLNYVNEVTCLCQNGMNHVKTISFKGQDLSGVLPGSLTKLPFLQIIDLAKNLLSGPIPREWTSMKNLTYFSIMANNLSGPIPPYLGNITSLTYLSVESNRFSGAVPAELGHLVNLQKLILNDNNLTGQLPEELKNLNNLIELRLGSNNFNGPLPDYFGSWTKLQKLEIQGSGYDGPIPPTISLLHNISELRITDLSHGSKFKFPALQRMGNLKRLVLRNCNISGSIPDYVAANLSLVELDLSFNRLEGSVPSNANSFPRINNLYLMHNTLSGQVPDWMAKNIEKSFKNIDLSYNSLDEMTVGCNGLENINLFRSFKGEKNLESTMCIKESNPCSKVVNSLHINCGGASTKVGKTTYEQDTTQGGAAKFVHAGVWGFSSSGDYWFAKDKSDYIVRNSALGVKDLVLYQDARIAATSLTYYGLCLAKGRYRVTLRFFEIVFGSNKSFASLGNRKFDIYIQETLVYKDFDIQSNGIDKPVALVFPDIYVNNSIEIRLYYAGKGSTAIPARETGAYGPLISAISVESELKPRLSRKTIIWISIGGASLLVLFGLLGLWKRCWRGKVTSREDDLVGLDLQTGLFTYRQIKAATNNFDSASMIGEGGFGSVYLGRLLDGTNIAVKKLSSKSSQGNREFINEIGMISGLHHPNLVKLYGCCIEGNQLFVIYEYMENNNLARFLFGPDDDDRMILDWPARKRISIDVARGLTFLHEESTFKVVHRDIKATNILLDRNLNAKISDFGLAKLDDEEHTHISTRVVGTIGYMAPEYALWGYLTYKADVYSFGVLLLEIVAGRNNTKFRPEENQFCLLDRAFVLQQKGDLRELVDPRLGQEYNAEEAIRMLKVALLCTNTSPELRPDMSSVLAMLDGTTLVHDPNPNPNPNMPSKEWLYHQISRTSHNEVGSEKDTQSLIISGGAPGYESSSKSEHDLYPVVLFARD